MKRSNVLRTVLAAAMLLSAVTLFSGCGDFFASPDELLNPTSPGTKSPEPTVIATDPTKDPVTPTNNAEPTATQGANATAPATSTPTATPTATNTPTPIPTVEEHPSTVNTDRDNTYTFIVNRAYPLPDNYEPSDLVSLSECQLDYASLTDPKHKMRKVAADALTEMFNAAKEENLTLVAVSGYRSFERQYTIYGHCLMVYTTIHTNRYSAVPGSSEHQTGLAMDLSCASAHNDLIDEFGETPEGKWVYEHCWEYGFIIRYPQGKTDITGYAYEPWHVRYVGVPLAYYLTKTGLTLEEYYGVKDPYTEDYLATHALIDTHTLKYHKLYASYSSAKLVYIDDKTAWEDPKTGYPYLILPVKTAKGKNLKNAKGALVYDEPFVNIFGEYYFDEKGNMIMKPVLRDSTGEPIVDKDGEPFFMEPLVEGNGNLVRDKAGNIVYKPYLTNADGSYYLDADGNPVMLVPLRDDDTSLVYEGNGEVVYFYPYADDEHFGDGSGQDYQTDYDGNLMYSPWYYISLEMENGIALTEPGVVAGSEVQ